MPSATGHLQYDGFPRAVLTADSPFVQIEEISGLHDEKINLQFGDPQPGGQPVTVKAVLQIVHGKPASPGRIDSPVTVVTAEQTRSTHCGPFLRAVRRGEDLSRTGLRAGGSTHGDFHFEYRVLPVQPAGTAAISPTA